MAIAIKSRNFTPNKCERTFEEGGGFGWAPGYEKKFKGRNANTARYSKNYSQMMGTCKKCDKFTDKTSTAGEHCSLPANESCEK